MTKSQEVPSRNSCRADTPGACAPDALVDQKTAERLANIFKALGDPTRVRIISALARCEVCVHELSQALGMTQSAISHQLRTLRDLDLVRYTKEGRHVYYTLADNHVRDLFNLGLEHVEHT